MGRQENRVGEVEKGGKEVSRADKKNCSMEK
jgi:hypothetical protein